MASELEYADVYDIETRSGEDYSKKNQKFTDRVIEGVISQGEKEIDTKTNNTFDGVRGYQECGLTLKYLTTATGLTADATYSFKINIDGTGVVEYIITIGTVLTYDELIILINRVISGAFFHLVRGDLRCSSRSFGSSSSIALTAGTTGTDLFVTLTGFAAFDVAVVGSGDMPKAVTYVVIETSYRRMFNMIITKGPDYTRDKDKHLLPVWEEHWDKLLEPFINVESLDREIWWEDA